MKTEDSAYLSDLTTQQTVKNLQFSLKNDLKNTQKFHENITLSFVPSCGVKYKYFNAFIIFISAICNCMVGVSFATINHQVSQYYGVSISMVSFCALITFIINPIVSLFANYILDNKGLKLGITINCILVIIGVSLRMLINESFYFIIIGNSITAMGNVFIVNCPPRFSAVWFKPSQRIIITSLIGFANAVSGQIGAILSPYFVPDGLTPEEGRKSIENLVNFQAFLIGSVMLMNLIFFRGIPSKPKTNTLRQNFFSEQQKSQSNSNGSVEKISSNLLNSQLTEEIIYSVRRPSQVDNKIEKPKISKRRLYLKQLKTLLTTKNYILMMIAFVCVSSVLSCFALNIELYIIPFGFTSADAGSLTFFSVATGLLGAIISSLIIKKIKKFKIVILVELFLSIIFSVAFIFSLIQKQKQLLYISVCLFTMILYPLFPAMIEYSCEFMYPIRQSTICGILVAGGQLFSFVIGMLQTKLLQSKSQKNAAISLVINAVCYFIALIGIFFTKQELKRLNSSKK